jgi:hypothetical protein
MVPGRSACLRHGKYKKAGTRRNAKKRDLFLNVGVSGPASLDTSSSDVDDDARDSSPGQRRGEARLKNERIFVAWGRKDTSEGKERERERENP